MSRTSPKARLSSPAARWVGFVVAIALLAWAIYYAIAKADFSALRDAEAGSIALLLIVMPLSALMLPGFLFWLTNRPFADPARPLRHHEMQALIAASGLLNYTPIKAGLIGRLAYLKHRHGIAYGASVIIFAMTSVALLSALAAAAGATLWRGRLDALWAAALIGIALPAAAVGTLFVQRTLPAPGAASDPDEKRLRHSYAWTFGHLLIWIGIGMLTLTVTAARFHIVIRMLDKTVETTDLVLIAVLHIFCSVLPLNGLGMREALMGLFFGGEAPEAFIAIALIDRAAETLVILVMGLAAIWLLKRRMAFAITDASTGSRQADDAR